MNSFSYLEPVCCSMSSSNCCFLTCIQISQEADQVVWYSHLFQNFPQLIVIYTGKGFAVISKAGKVWTKQKKKIIRRGGKNTLKNCTNKIFMNQISNCQHLLDHQKKAREFQKNIYFCFIDYVKVFDCVDHNKLCKIMKEMGMPDNLTCILRNLYAGQEETVRTGHGTTTGSK